MSFFFLIHCTRSQNNTESVFINPENFVPAEINLSKFANSISYIPLSNEHPIAHIYTIQSMHNKIFIGVNPQKIMVFDLQGKFLNSIGKEGRGPGEYQYAFNFALDHKNKYIYVLNKNKILVFLENGIFKNEIDISHYQGNFDAIGYNQGYIFLFENIKFGAAKYNWLIIDTKGNLITSKLNSIPQFNSFATEMINVMFTSNDHFYYWNSFNDTIFNVSPMDYKVKYLFAKNEYRITTQNIRKTSLYSDRIFIPRKFWESKHYLFFSFFMEGKNALGLIDKEKNETLKIEAKESQSNQFGYLNDIDGGPVFNPSCYLILQDCEYLVGSINASDLITYFNNISFHHSSPKYPEKKKELEQLSNSLNENNNPVLMLVKLKK